MYVCVCASLFVCAWIMDQYDLGVFKAHHM